MSRIDQMILNQFLKDGYYERHLNRMRIIYGKRHDFLLKELKKIKGCRITGENAGVHLLVEFVNGMTEEEGIRKAKEEGVKVYPLSEYEIRGPEENIIREEKKSTVILGYATLSEPEILEAARRLGRAWGSGSDLS